MTTEQNLKANPLHSFRAPRGIRHPNVDGDYFTTQQKDIANDTGALNIYPGMFRYKPDPTLEVDFAIWEDYPDTRAVANLHRMISREGYEIVKADEWEIIDGIAAMTWKRDGAGRLTFGGMNTHTLVLLFRTGEAADESRKNLNAQNAKISKTPAELRAEMAEKLGPLGASVRVNEQVEEMSDEDMVNYEEKLARKGL